MDPCVICQEPVENGPEIQVCPTGHAFFHPTCLNDWKKYQKGRLFCPICRHVPGGNKPDRGETLFSSLSREIRMNRPFREDMPYLFGAGADFITINVPAPEFQYPFNVNSTTSRPTISRSRTGRPERSSEIDANDVRIVAEQARCTLERAAETLVKHHGDIVEALIELTS